LFFSLSVAVNLAFLGFFKYYNFFAENFALAMHKLGFHPDIVTLHIILPVGISFYTFHSLSYVIDVFHRRKTPCHDPSAFFAFISFFPLLVAGPIVRSTQFLPQFEQERKFDPVAARDGLRQMLWGFFKKMVVADNCARWVNAIFPNYAHESGATLLAGAVLFAFQIYGDFSGYSDIAIGTARLFGFSLMKNFSFPYFSRDIAEFWRRWHISLSTWFRDYVYIPLGGSKVSKAKVVRNTFIIFLLSGFWHGANWTFITWGLLHALYFMPLLLFGWNRNNLETVAHGKVLPSVKELLQITVTFALVTLAWIFFRAPNVQEALGYIQQIFTAPYDQVRKLEDESIGTVAWFIALMMVVEWLQREHVHGLNMDRVEHKAVRWLAYMTVAMLIFFHGASQQTFIYFQF
jgi:D-alanyl-lipoteichoic acid acyltransferase DltB (MBOAT superfamily)